MHDDSINLTKLSQLTNPYDIPQDQLARVQAWVSHEDRMLLKSVFPLRGMETFLLAGIYKTVCEQLRKENILTYTPDNARRAKEIITCHLAALCAPRQGRIEDVPRGGDQVHQPHSNSPHQPTDSREATPGRRGNRGGTRSKRGGETKEGQQAEG